MKDVLCTIALAMFMLVACGTQATPVATESETATPVPPSVTPSLTPAPTATATPFLAVDLLIRGNACNPQQVYFGQPLVLPKFIDLTPGPNFQYERTAEAFIEKAVVTIKIDQNEPITLKDPSLWSAPAVVTPPPNVQNPMTFYTTSMNWTFPALSVGKHHIEIDINESTVRFAGTYCTDLTVVMP